MKLLTELYLNEVRGSLLQRIKDKFPNWPDYVIRDLLYQQAKTIDSHEQFEDWYKHIEESFPIKEWKFETLDITLDIFDKFSRDQIMVRDGGKVNPHSVPKDEARHATQLKMIQQRGVRKEPIIVIKNTDGFGLVEGWHRTIQHLQAFPQGYKGTAWVGYK